MGRPPRSGCFVCRDARKEQVDAELRAGKSILSLHKRYGIPYGSINGHWKNGHVPPPPVDSPEAEAALEDAVRQAAAALPAKSTPVDVAQKIVDSLSNIDVSRLSQSAQSQHVQTLLRAVDTLERIRPTPPPPPVGSEELERMRRIQAAEMEVLERYPEVRREMAEALRRLGGGA